MLIANPLYDSAFKYLLEDLDLAREFLATMLGEEIVSIEVKPQETLTELTERKVTIFRLDFKAVIQTRAGERRKVLIELQKAKHALDIMRFRRYLAVNYQEEDAVGVRAGAFGNLPLPIVTIYLLGFKLATGYPAICKMEQQARDVPTGEIVAPRPREPFVELLNHESYVVQIPLLTDTTRTRLEGALMVFNQEHRTDNPQVLNYTGDLSDPLVKRMVERLARAASDQQVRREMEAEEEVEGLIARNMQEERLRHQTELQAALQAAQQEKEAALQAAQQEKAAALQAARQEKEAALQAARQEQDVALQEKDAKYQAELQELARQMAELRQQLAELRKLKE